MEFKINAWLQNKMNGSMTQVERVVIADTEAKAKFQLINEFRKTHAVVEMDVISEPKQSGFLASIFGKAA
jgi:hypothetical protein